MSMPGMGVMIAQLSGNSESVEAFKAAIGKTISALTLGQDDALHFTFEDGSKIKLFDDGQSCCESRYMRTDNTLADYIGGMLVSAETRSAPEYEDDNGEVHEVEFLVVKTNRGDFTMSSHNKHNGYYGGFAIRCAVE